MSQKQVSSTVLTEVRIGYSTTPGGDNLAVGGAGPQPAYNNAVYMTFPSFGLPAGSVINSADLKFDMIGWDYKAQCQHDVQACEWAGTPTSQAPVTGSYNGTLVPYNTLVDHFVATNAAKQMYASGKYYLKQFVHDPGDNRKTFSTAPAVLTIDYTAPTAPTAPSGLSSNKSSDTSVLRLSWSKGSDGTLNPITGQELRYQTSSNGSTWSSEVVVSKGVNDTYHDISDGAVDGWGLPKYVRFRVGSKSSYASTVYSGYSSSYRIPEPPSVASGLSCNKSSSTSVLRLSWTPGSSGASNAITGQELRYQTSSNGSTWGTEVVLSLSTSTSYYDISDATVDSWGLPRYVRFRVGSKSNYSSTVYSGYSSTYQISSLSPSAAVSLSASPNAFYTSLTFLWSAGSGDAVNPVTGQEVRYQISDDGVVWSSETVVDVASSTESYAVPEATVNSWGLGKRVRYRIGTKSDYASTAYSGYSLIVRKNRAPNPPIGTPTTNNFIYSPGEIITVSFTPPSPRDPDNGLTGDISGYEVKMQDSEGVDYNGGQIMGTNASATATLVLIDTTGWTAGNQWKFLVRGYDTYGVRGSWSSPTDLVMVGTPMRIPINGALKQGVDQKIKIDGELKQVLEMKIKIEGALKTLTV